MSTDYNAELDALAAAVNTEGNEECIDDSAPIEIIGREINMPKTEVYAVCCDTNSQILTFQMDRFVEGVDLNTKIPSIKFKNALGQCDRATPYSVSLSDDKITLAWKLDKNVTAKDGTVTFQIEFFQVGEGNLYSWQTKMQTFDVLPTLDVDGDIEEYTPTWVQEVTAAIYYLAESLKILPSDVNIDDVTIDNGFSGEYLINDGERLLVYTGSIADEGADYITVPFQIKLHFDEDSLPSKYKIESRYYKDGEWSEWEQSFSTANLEKGVLEDSFQSKSSSAGAMVFKFDLTHKYTEEDILKQRYYILWPNPAMKGKPFSIVLGENYDFVGTITDVYNSVEPEYDGGSYITVDNYIAPSTTDTRYRIDKDSYILLPYDTIEDGGTYAPLDYYVVNGAHKLGDTEIGLGASSLGYKCYAHSDGAFAAGWMNIASGKHSGTLGRFNVMGYCDFGFGQDLKFFGHWNGGFGRDNYIDRLADFCFVAGRDNFLYASYTSALGIGHTMYMPYSNARGMYSETDKNNKYIDRVGYGTNKQPKNIYTLDKSGNAWFRGDLHVGGTNYDNSARVPKAFTVNSFANLLSIDAKQGDTAIYINTVDELWCDLENSGASYGLVLDVGAAGTDSYVTEAEIGGRKCFKIPDEYSTGRDTRYIRFHADGAYANKTDVTITFEYFDEGTGLITLQYNSTNGSIAQSIRYNVYLTNTRRWKTAKFTISDAQFCGGINGSDFRIGGKTPDATYISSVTALMHTPGEISKKQVRRSAYMLTGTNTLKNWVEITNI